MILNFLAVSPLININRLNANSITKELLIQNLLNYYYHLEKSYI